MIASLESSRAEWQQRLAQRITRNSAVRAGAESGSLGVVVAEVAGRPAAGDGWGISF